MKTKLISIFSSFGALLLGCFGGSCGVVCLASGCCGSTALLGFLGLSGSTMGFLSELTPVFLGLTVVSLAWGFYVAYKPQKASCCEQTPSDQETNSSCCTPKKKRSFYQSKEFMWITTIICIVMWTFPYVFSDKNASQQCCPTQDSSKVSSCCPPQNDSVKTSCCPTDTTPAFTPVQFTNTSNNPQN